MLWDLVEDYVNAAGDGAKLAAADGIVRLLQESPLVVHFRPDGPTLFTGSANVAVLGRQVGLLDEFGLCMSSRSQRAEVRAVLPFDDTPEELQVREVMEEGYETAKSADRYARLLESVGVDVERVPL